MLGDIYTIPIIETSKLRGWNSKEIRSKEALVGGMGQQ